MFREKTELIKLDKLVWMFECVIATIFMPSESTHCFVLKKNKHDKRGRRSGKKGKQKKRGRKGEGEKRRGKKKRTRGKED